MRVLMYKTVILITKLIACKLQISKCNNINANCQLNTEIEGFNVPLVFKGYIKYQGYIEYQIYAIMHLYLDLEYQSMYH